MRSSPATRRTSPQARPPFVRARAALTAAGMLAAVAVAVQNAGAQSAVGPLENASVPSQWELRFGIATEFVTFDERFGDSGEREPLLARLAFDALGSGQLPALGAVEGALRSLTGLTDFRLSLGRTTTSASARVTVVPVSLELGVTRRIAVGILVPYIFTRVDAFADINRDASGANVGINPVLAGGEGAAAALAANAAFVAQLDAASAALQQSIDQCRADPGASPDCPAILADGPGLVASSGDLAAGIASVFGIDAGSNAGALVVPLAGSGAQLALGIRIELLRQALESLGAGSAFTALGPSFAAAPATFGQSRALLEAMGFGADPIARVDRSHIGDVELGLKMLLFDGMAGAAESGDGGDDDAPAGLRTRAAVAARVRLGTGEPDSPNNFADLGTGDGQTDIELGIFADVALGSRIQSGLAARYGWQLADERAMRIPLVAGSLLAPEYSLQTVQRDLGDYVELEVNPRYAVARGLAVIGHYRYRRIAEHRYSGMFPIDAATTGFGDVVLDAANIASGAAQQEHRAGLGIVYSTADARTRGAGGAVGAGGGRGMIPVPVEVSLLHVGSFAGSGGQPVIANDRVQVRIFFGGR